MSAVSFFQVSHDFVTPQYCRCTRLLSSCCDAACSSNVVEVVVEDTTGNISLKPSKIEHSETITESKSSSIFRPSDFQDKWCTKDLDLCSTDSHLARLGSFSASVKWQLPFRRRRAAAPCT
jgi:hypothetical protein